MCLSLISSWANSQTLFHIFKDCLHHPQIATRRVFLSNTIWYVFALLKLPVTAWSLQRKPPDLPYIRPFIIGPQGTFLQAQLLLVSHSAPPSKGALDSSSWPGQNTTFHNLTNLHQLYHFLVSSPTSPFFRCLVSPQVHYYLLLLIPPGW